MEEFKNCSILKLVTLGIIIVWITKLHLRVVPQYEIIRVVATHTGSSKEKK